MLTRHALAVLAAFALFPGFEASFAGETVTFETPAVPPSAFKIKRAKAQGKVAEPTPGIRLSAILSRPQRDGVFPAVVILSEGDGQQASNLSWMDFLAENGFVTLFVQSFASRGTKSFEDSPSLDMVVDAQSAHRYLSGLDHVDGSRIGLLGFGQSGWFAQRTIDVALKDQPGATVFSAAVALYPHCDPGTEVTAPLLILAGGRDTRMSLTSCREMVDMNRGKGMDVTLHVYSDALHSFDNRNYVRDASLRGTGWVEPTHFEQGAYDPDVHADAKARVLDFFRQHLN